MVLAPVLAPLSTVSAHAHAQPVINISRLITSVQPAQLQLIGTNLTGDNGCTMPSIILNGVSLPIITFTDTLIAAQVDDSIANSPGTYRVVLQDCDAAHSADFIAVIGDQGPEGPTGPSGTNRSCGQADLCAGAERSDRRLWTARTLGSHGCDRSDRWYWPVGCLGRGGGDGTLGTNWR